MNQINMEFVVELLRDYGYLDDGLLADLQRRYDVERARQTRRRRTEGNQPPNVAQVVGGIALPSPLAVKEVIDEDLVMELVARRLGFPYEKIDPLKVDSNILGSVVSRPFARKHLILPIRKQDGKLQVAMANPFDTEVIETVERLTGLRVVPVVSSQTDIEKSITDVMGFKKTVEKAAKEVGEYTDIHNLEQLFSLGNMADLEIDDRYVVSAVDYLFHYAFEQGATDIHIEPLREESRIRLRIDGVLHVIYTFPKPAHQAMVNRIKTMARLDIAERRRPQDGRLKSQTGDGNEIELRISTLWTAFGEKIVIRVFDAGRMIQSVDNLGLFPEQKTVFKRLVSSSTGLILVTGPTGSGKTTTLYSTLKDVSNPSLNITTIEDPIEMVIEEFNQVAVHRRIDFDFANALKHILRQDPDIIMVGEIRDEETAQNALEAAMTGHLVFATLHTNDAAGAAIRLEELGIKRYLIASALRGVVAQRLVRKICPYCKQKVPMREEELRILDLPTPEAGKSVSAYTGEGCVSCRQTGYLGRTGVFEIMEVTDRISRMIKGDADSRELTSAARQEGLSTIRESGIKLLAQGITDYNELMRVLAMAR